MSVADNVSNWNVYTCERVFKIFRLTAIMLTEYRKQLQSVINDIQWNVNQDLKKNKRTHLVGSFRELKIRKKVSH